MTHFEIIQLDIQARRKRLQHQLAIMNNQHINQNDPYNVLEREVVHPVVDAATHEFLRDVIHHAVNAALDIVIPCDQDYRTPSPAFSEDDSEDDNSYYLDDDFNNDSFDLYVNPDHHDSTISDDQDNAEFFTPMQGLPDMPTVNNNDVIPILYNTLTHEDIDDTIGDASMHSLETSTDPTATSNELKASHNADDTITSFKGFTSFLDNNEMDMVIQDFQTRHVVEIQELHVISIWQAYYDLVKPGSSLFKHSLILPMPHDAKLIWRVNLHNIPNNKPVTVVSFISPSIGANAIYEYMICHICHFHPGMHHHSINGEGPFVKTPGGMLQHLLSQHCRKAKIHVKRPLTREAIQYLKSINEQIRRRQFVPCLHSRYRQKFLSTSCLAYKWKSDEPHLTKGATNAYVFDDDLCRGHTKTFPSSGWPIILDLAISVYCSCMAGRRACHCNDNSILTAAPPKTFVYPKAMGCKQTKTSISRHHNTFICPYLVEMKWPVQIPAFIHPSRRPETRSETLYRRLLEQSLHEDIIRQQHLVTSKQQLPITSRPTAQCRSPSQPVTSRPHLFSPLLYQKQRRRRPRLGATSTPTPRAESLHTPMHTQAPPSGSRQTPSHPRPPPLLRLPIRPIQSTAVFPRPTRAVRPFQAAALDQPRSPLRGQPEGQAAQAVGAGRRAPLTRRQAGLSGKESEAYQYNKGGGRNPRAGYPPDKVRAKIVFKKDDAGPF